MTDIKIFHIGEADCEEMSRATNAPNGLNVVWPSWLQVGRAFLSTRIGLVSCCLDE